MSRIAASLAISQRFSCFVSIFYRSCTETATGCKILISSFNSATPITYKNDIETLGNRQRSEFAANSALFAAMTPRIFFSFLPRKIHTHNLSTLFRLSYRSSLHIVQACLMYLHIADQWLENYVGPVPTYCAVVHLIFTTLALTRTQPWTLTFWTENRHAAYFCLWWTLAPILIFLRFFVFESRVGRMGKTHIVCNNSLLHVVVITMSGCHRSEASAVVCPVH